MLHINYIWCRWWCFSLCITSSLADVCMELHSGDMEIPGPHLNIKNIFPGIRIIISKIRRSWDRLILNMGISILVRRHIHIETAPCCLSSSLLMSWYQTPLNEISKSQLQSWLNTMKPIGFKSSTLSGYILKCWRKIFYKRIHLTFVFGIQSLVVQSQLPYNKGSIKILSAQVICWSPLTGIISTQRLTKAAMPL